MLHLEMSLFRQREPTAKTNAANRTDVCVCEFEPQHSLAFNISFRAFYAHCIHPRKGAFMPANFLVLIALGSFITDESFKKLPVPV